MINSHLLYLKDVLGIDQIIMPPNSGNEPLHSSALTISSKEASPTKKIVHSIPLDGRVTFVFVQSSAESSNQLDREKPFADEHAAFFDKILGALNLDRAQVALVDLKIKKMMDLDDSESNELRELFLGFQESNVVLFGQTPEILAKALLQEIPQHWILTSTLSDLVKNPELKKPLWGSLKKARTALI